VGWSIVLYPTKVQFQGKMVDAIRVDDRPGATKKSGNRPAPPPRVVEEDELDMPDDDSIPF
jgi:hypothetical protein